MNRTIIIRIRSAEGQHRLTIDSHQSYAELLLAISRKLHYPISSITVKRDNETPVVLEEDVRLANVPYFVDGAILKVETSEPIKPSHSGLAAADLEYR